MLKIIVILISINLVFANEKNTTVEQNVTRDTSDQCVPSFEINVTNDIFDQCVPSIFEVKIKEAKKTRLPYSEDYDPKKSIQILKSMIKEKQDYYRGYYNLGLAYFEDGNYTMSNDSFDKAFEIRSENNISEITIFNSAGWTSLKAQNYKRAERLFLEGLKIIDEMVGDDLDNSKRKLNTNLGLLYFYTQRFEKAKKYLKVAIQYDNSDSASATLKIINAIEEDKKNEN